MVVLSYKEAMRNDQLELLISQEAIHKKIIEFSHKLDKEYAGKEIALIVILKGAICFAADLIRHMKNPSTVQFLQASSYGLKGTKKGKLHLFGLENIKIAGQDVLVVDDIFDSGETLTKILASLKRKRPKSLKSMVLLEKKVPRKTSYIAEYILFEIENYFVVGYGLDYKEKYRGLSGIYKGNL
jgi:hypoxanthine phosphoribosyltransferase